MADSHSSYGWALKDPGSSSFSSSKLNSREQMIQDEISVEEYKNELRDGDVIVLIDEKCHFVNYDNLCATDSTQFTPNNGGLLNANMQRKLRARSGYTLGLPQGCSYILDLSPPTDGDEAVEMVSRLSCSPGICNWYLYSQKANISNSAIGGEDELDAPGFLLNGGSSPASPAKLTELTNAKRGLDMTDWELRDMDIAIKRSLKDLFEDRELSEEGKPLVKRDVDDYNLVRHKVGIVNLLKLVEGKDCTLDSAPKVWTLFGIAEYFDCKPATVVDKILAWLVAEPNHLFIEILPEATLNIGIGLKQEWLTKLAFSVLVSEHAMMVAKSGVNANGGRGAVTRFLRLKEELDDNKLNIVQEAGTAFQARITAEYMEFVEPAMLWIEQLPEFQKLLSFETACGSKTVITILMNHLRNFVRSGILACLFVSLDGVQNFSANLHRTTEQYMQEWDLDFNQHVYSSLSPPERILTTFFWQILFRLNWNESTPGLSDLPGFSTAPFEEDLYSADGNVSIDNPTIFPARDYAVAQGVLPLDKITLRSCVSNANQTLQEAHLDGTDTYGVPGVSTSGTVELDSSDPSQFTADDLIFSLPFRPKPKEESTVSAGRLDTLVTESEGNVKSHGGEVHLSGSDHAADDGDVHNSGLDNGADDEDTPAGDEGMTLAKSVFDANQPLDYVNGISWEERGKGKEVQAAESDAQTAASQSRNSGLTDSTPLFVPTAFFKQVKNYVQSVALKYLQRGPFEDYGFNLSILVTDTLLCLTDNEYAFLPLSVGGNDDQTGGVYTQPIPEAYLGPSGPGPAFHTGHTAASSASSERWETSSAGTTLGVEDGRSSHIDRRVVLSDDGILSERFSTDSEEYGVVDFHQTLPTVTEESDDDLIDMSPYEELFEYKSDEDDEDGEDDEGSDSGVPVEG